MTYDPNTRLAKIICPIVEGQLKSFLHDHPEVAEAWTGKLANGKTKAEAVKDSAAKRIVRDLLCESSIARLRAALVEDVGCAPLGEDVELASASSGADLESDTGSVSSRPYEDGKHARLLGLDQRSNPYLSKTEDWWAWNAGFDTANTWGEMTAKGMLAR